MAEESPKIESSDAPAASVSPEITPDAPASSAPAEEPTAAEPVTEPAVGSPEVAAPSNLPPVQEAIKPLRQNDAAMGTIIAIHKGDVLVEFSGKDQGVCPADHFPDGLPKVGDRVEFRTTEYLADEGMWKLRVKGFGVGEVDIKTLEKGMVVEGRVTGMNTGGLELKIAGVRAFMPSSQIDIEHVDNFSPYLNQKLQCKIMELNSNKKRMVVSRRAIMEGEAEDKKAELLGALEIGSVMEGKVRSIQKFGAFVQIQPGVDGLVHISDISHARINKVEDKLKVDDVVQVKLLKVNQETGKISLGMKQVEPDPWKVALEQISQGDEITGRVTRLADFGAFVEIAPGVEGLIPMGEMGWNRVEKASDVLSENETVKVKVTRIEQKKKRVSLSIKQMSQDPWKVAAEKFNVDDTVKGKVTKIMTFGAFVEIAEGVEGLIHISALDTKRVSKVEDIVKVGDEVEVKILSIELPSRKIGLSRKALLPGGEDESQGKGGGKASRHDVRSHIKKQGKAKATESLGALLDKFGGPDDGLKGGIG